SDRINVTRPHSHWKTTRGYKHQEVTTYLTVSNALFNDSGVYTCSATDHSFKTGQATANIVVYATQQPIHVNFTTDMNLSEPVVHQAGQNVKFVITVDAYPSSVSEIYWLKDGQLLQPDNSHFRIETKEKTVVLEIHHLLRSDAGNYTLVGKVKDVVSSISIILEVKGSF
ncbi:platelet-derived growth factor receptor alpha-like, partial [Parasteatoda tepidariorum]|uniref:platelet-derived growth factor receptor alpha-like n=1 Tax=Parasteatoda tepidariorum TaxID=114398 RepID=UPI0039BD034D